MTLKSDFPRAVRVRQVAVVASAAVLILFPVSPRNAAAESDQDGMVVFSSERDGQPLDVYLVDRQGNGVHRVTNHERTGPLVGPLWSTERRAAFARVFHPLPAMDSERPRFHHGSFQVQMTSQMHRRNLPADDTWPSLSHTQPAVETFHLDDGQGFHIYAREWKSEESRKLGDAPNSFHAVWSPDSESIAFLSDRHGPVEVFVMDREGEGLVRLAPGVTAHRPVWAWPFGHGAISGEGVPRLAFLGSVEEDRLNVYVVGRDGSGLVNVSRDPIGVDGFCWSWNGTEIAFSSKRDGNREIYVVGADGGHLRNVTNHKAEDDRFSWVSPNEAEALLTTGAVPEADLLEAGMGPVSTPR